MADTFQPPSFFDRQSRLPTDPVLDQKGEHVRDEQHGRTPMLPTHKGDKGTITEAFPDTQTYTVQSERSGELRGVPRLLQDLGDTRVLSRGTTVAISYDYGQPVIVGVFPYTSGKESNVNTLSLTGDGSTGGNDPANAGKGDANFRLPNMPRDMGQADWAQVGQEGNAIAVLSGGVNTMKSGLAEVRTHLLKDLVEIICRNFRMETDMGTTEIKNDAGRISWSFRGGADQLTEAGSDKENWTIRIDLGADGDMFRFELTRPDGGTLFKFHVNNDGKLSIFGADGVDISSGAPHTEKHLDTREIVIKRNDAQTIGGDQSKTIQGSRDTLISTNDARTVGNDRTESVARHLTESIGGNHVEKVVGGNAATALPTNVARETSINNGSWEVEIGNPLNGANPAALAGFLLKTFTGDIEMGAQVKGNIDFNTLLGNVIMQTIAGNATLKTALGLANVDGTTVHLGPIGPSFANPVIKGTLHTTAMGAYTSANIAALSPAIAATGALIGVVAGAGPILWPVGPIMAPAFAAWASAILAALTALLASNTALAAALPTTLSTKAFTA